MSNCYDISDKKNFYSTFPILSIHDSIELFEKYISLTNEYIDIFFKDVNIEEIHYLLYIFFKGLTMIESVYTILLLYSKNIDLSFYHTQKSIYYYIEFISRLSNEQDTFIKITPTDAVLFVYKKTIHNLNSDIYKNVSKDEIIDFKECIHCYTHLIIDIFNMFFNKTSTIKEYNKVCLYLKEIYHKALDDILNQHVDIKHRNIYTYLLDYYNEIKNKIRSKNKKDDISLYTLFK